MASVVPHNPDRGRIVLTGYRLADGLTQIGLAPSGMSPSVRMYAPDRSPLDALSLYDHTGIDLPLNTFHGDVP